MQAGTVRVLVVATRAAGDEGAANATEVAVNPATTAALALALATAIARRAVNDLFIVSSQK